MRIVLPPLPNVTSRVVSLDVQVADEQHTYQTVWSGTDLRYQAIVAPRWESRLATGVRLVVHRQVEPLGETDKVVVEEIVFPGYQVIPPP